MMPQEQYKTLDGIQVSKATNIWLRILNLQVKLEWWKCGESASGSPCEQTAYNSKGL